MSNPLEITATIGGRERKLCFSALGIYKAVTDFGHACEDDLEELFKKAQAERQNGEEQKRPRVTTGKIFQIELEELWMAVLHYEDISKEQFLAEIAGDDMLELQRIWMRMKGWQGDMIEDTESEDEPNELPEALKKKHEDSSYLIASES